VGAADAGRKTRWSPEIAAKLRRLADGFQRLQQYRRDEREALQPILGRLVAIERALGLREKIKRSRIARRLGRRSAPADQQWLWH